MASISEVLSARLSSSSRADGVSLALIIEGGGSRGVYGGGMIQAVESLGLATAFDAVYGTSAGALNGAWLLSDRVTAGMRTWTDESILRRSIDPGRMLRGKPPFNLKYLVHGVYDGVEPMDFDAILAHDTTFHPVATDARTGSPVDLAPFITDKSSLMAALRATCCLPLVSGPPVPLNGSSYFDGGLTESVPIRMALRAGATHAVVLRTRRLDERSESAPVVRSSIGDAYMRIRVPGAFDAWRDRGKQQALEEAAIADMGDQVLEIRPPLGSPFVDGSSRDGTLMTAAMSIGRTTALTALGEAIDGAR